MHFCECGDDLIWQVIADSCEQNYHTATLQSGEVSTTPQLVDTTDVSEDKQENIEFVDSGVPETKSLTTLFEESYTEHTDEIGTLGNYLNRPVLIDSFTWNESDTFSLTPRTIFPWHLYFNNTYIKSKLANYSRIHCNLHLEFRFNASPFYYGVMRVVYDPLKTGKFMPKTTTDIIPMSQTHGVKLEPHVTSVAELDLPFVYPNTWLNTGSAMDFKRVGQLHYAVFSQLRSANGVTGSGITISVYASARNVEISGPTIFPLLQSGIISTPASAVSEFAKRFSNSGSIGPYARAVSIGAAAVSSIARIFGYSNAPVTSNVEPRQNKVYHAFANTETSVPIDKLAIDPKNEVTIDNRTAGADGDDPLIIQKLVTHPSVVSVVNWPDSAAAATILQYGIVSPCIQKDVAGTGQTFNYMTPGGWIGSMFRFWRGGMRYRFRVVRSQYHKGRLMVCWDPNTGLNTVGNETALFSKIFDLSSPEQEFVIDIPFKAAAPWLKTMSVEGCRSTVFGHYDEGDNGTFTLSVVNPLTAPVTGTSVDIIIYAEALEDMEFAGPKTLPRFTTASEVQSGPVDDTKIEYSEHVPDFTVGERIGSLRPLLHRTSKAITQVLGIPDTSLPDGGYTHTTNAFHRLPPVYGFADAVNNINYATSVISTGSKPCNFCYNHPINWILYAFAGYRGSVVVHANVTCGGNVDGMSNMQWTRSEFSPFGLTYPAIVKNAGYRQWSLTAGLNASVCKAAMWDSWANGEPQFPQCAGGTSVTNGRTQMAVSAVFPQYLRSRFHPAWPTQRFTELEGNFTYDSIRLDTDFVYKEGVTDGSTFPTADFYWAAGVDFNPIFFTGVPRLVTYNPPAIVNVLPLP